MAEDVDLPLSVLNALPGVSGVEDVGFQVPDPEDIGTALEEEIPPVVKDALRDVDPEEIIGDAIDAGQDPQELAEDLATELPEQLEQVDVDIEAGLFGPTEEDLEGIISGTLEPDEPIEGVDALSNGQLQEIVATGEPKAGVGPEEARDALTERSQVVTGEAPEPEESPFNISSLNPLGAIQELARAIEEAVTDILAAIEAIAEVFTDEVVDFLQNPIDFIQEAILGIQPVLSVPANSPVDVPADPPGFDEQGRPQVGFFTNFPEFLRQAVVNLVDEIASDASQQNLQEAVASAQNALEEA